MGENIESLTFLRDKKQKETLKLKTNLRHLWISFTGLDPADPYFQGTDVRVRLDPSDAAFVDVIHTDGSSILQLGFGTMQQMGHVDFYPNGGSNQPGCDSDFIGKISHTLWSAVTQLDTLGMKQMK